MATYGSRPALYKPTDFSSQQKRSSASTTSATTTAEVKKEEDKVTFKIQQRPILGTTPDQKPPAMENNKSVKILTESCADMKKGNHVKIGEEKPAVAGGVAQKDLDKIAKLKEFMARQQTADKEEKPPTPGGVTMLQMNGEKEMVAAVIKANLLNAKPHIPIATKIATTSTSAKTFPMTKTLLAPHDGKVVNGEKKPPGILTGVLPAKAAATIPSKPLKENKDPEIAKEEKPGKGKGQKDVVTKDGKKKGGAGRATMNRNQKNIVKSTPPVGAATNNNKPVQNEKPGGKTNKSKETTQRTKQPAKPSSTNASNVGARPKIIASKAPMNTQRTPNEAHKNQHRPYDRSQMHAVNSYYSQANKIPGFPNNELPPWLPYAMNTMNMNGGQSILGQPQGPRVDFAPKPVPAVHHDKNSDKSKPIVNGPPASTTPKKVVTVEATKDKSEQKKSLDFVKSFFDTDPEVQYHRKINAEKRNSANAAPVVSAPVVSVAKEEPVVVVSRHHVNNHTNNVNTHFSSHGGDMTMSNHVNSHFSSHADVSNHVNSHFSSLADNHSVPGGHVSNYGNISHANSRLVNNTLNNNQVNSQSFVHSTPHIPGSHIPGAPGSHIAGSHIPGSMASSYSSVYHHTNVSNLAHNAALHPNPQSGHFQGSSTVSPVHMGANPTQLHPAISSHPSSLHHRQQTYDLYSQVNPLPIEPDRFIKYCSVMNANYPGY